MGVRATWSSPKTVDAEITDYFQDQYGTEIDDDNFALVLGQDGDCFVIEGSADELIDLLEELREQVDGFFE